MKPRATDLEFNTVRHRLAYVLFCGSVLNWAAFVATITVVTVAARALSGSTMVAGLPLAAGVFGQALGTNLFGWLSARHGRRRVMLKGPLVSGAGAILELAGLMAESLWPLVVGAMLVGGGVGAAHLTRYTAAELVRGEPRGWALGLAVWAGTLGSLVGANLVDWAGRMMEEGLGTPYAGAFVVAVAGFLLCWLLFWVALPLDPPRVEAPTRSGSPVNRRAGRALGLPAVQIAMLVLLSAQATMVLVMTATPLHIEDTDYDLKVVGLVISALAVGMFPFAPLVGRLVDLTGYLPALVLGAMITWFSLFLSGTAPYDGYPLLIAGLFLLGLGWCFCFVAGSSMLFASAPAEARRVLGGVAGWATWTTMILGSVGAGMLMSRIGYDSLNLVAAGPLLVVFSLVLSTPRFRAAFSS